jgi:hypothetical protein
VTQLFIYKSRNHPETSFAAYGDWESVFSSVGVCEVVALKVTSRGREPVLRPIERFPSFVRLHELKKTAFPEGKSIAALKQGNIATLYETSRDEAWDLLGACGSGQSTRFAKRAKP